MFESLNEPLDVLTAFVEGRVEPLRFRWGGRIVRVARVTGRWTRREGQTQLQCFSLESTTADSYEISYDPRGPRWNLNRVWAGRTEEKPS
jgi:hypothetical protein